MTCEDDLLIIYCFTSRPRIFHLYGDVTITGEGLQNLGLCSALRAFKQGGIFIVPHLLWHGASVFPVSSEGPPHSVAFYDALGDVEDLFYPGSSQVPYQSPFTTHKEMWRTYSNPDPHGVLWRWGIVSECWIACVFISCLYEEKRSIACVYKSVQLQWRIQKYQREGGAPFKKCRFLRSEIFNFTNIRW